MGLPILPVLVGVVVDGPGAIPVYFAGYVRLCALTRDGTMVEVYPWIPFLVFLAV